MTTKHNQIKRDRQLLVAAISYAFVACMGALFSLTHNLPAEFLGHVPEASVAEDFLLPWGWGTGTSPAFILIALVLTFAYLLKKGIGKVILWRWTLTIAGVLFAIGQLGEPHTYQFFSGSRSSCRAGYDHHSPAHDIIWNTIVTKETS